jgi:beta-N-acetylhexosaminidase
VTRPLLRPLAFALALALALLALAPAALATAQPPAPATPTPTRAEMLGQRMMVSFTGTTPSAALLSRITAGQVGGVILFGSNIKSASQLLSLTRKLQAAARAGTRPRLLIATDQEGGLVRRLPWAPPAASAQQLGTTSTAHIRSVGHAAGVALRQAGVNLDLAPVADVPRRSDNFLLAQHRAFSTSRFVVADDTAAFAKGLEGGGVLPAYKHFPGLGRAGATSTDDAVVHIDATTTQIGRDLLPYRIALRRTLRPVIMLSTAVYPAYSSNAAAWSPAIVQTLLRGRLGFGGVTITDALSAAASVRGTTPGKLAVRSARAGADVLLVTGSDATSQAAFNRLLKAARSGAIPASNLQASYNRILRLKSRL